MNKCSKIGLIGDIHGEDKLLEKTLDFLSSKSLNIIMNTGDICDGIGGVNRYIDLLMKYNVQTVRGIMRAGYLNLKI